METTLQQRAELERLAKAATPGPRRHSRPDMTSYRADDGFQVSYVYFPEPNERMEVATDRPVEDATFIAATSPDMVLALLAERDELEKEHAKTKDALIKALAMLAAKAGAP